MVDTGFPRQTKGFADDTSNDLGIALLKEIDLGTRVLTPVRTDSPTVIVAARMLLADELDSVSISTLTLHVLVCHLWSNGPTI